MTGSDWWSIAGGLAQAAGVSLAAWDVAAILGFRKRRSDATVLVGTVRGKVDIAGSVVAVGGRQPTFEERVERIETEVRSLDERLTAVPRQLKREFQEAIDERARLIEQNI